jgi:uncharacterized repeat protein (TIGR01451 family)
MAPASLAANLRLTVDVTATPETVTASSGAETHYVRFAVSIANTGGGTATHVSFTGTPPPGTTLVALRTSQGSCDLVAHRCSLQSLATRASATVDAVFQAPSAARKQVNYPVSVEARDDSRAVPRTYVYSGSGTAAVSDPLAETDYVSTYVDPQTSFPYLFGTTQPSGDNNDAVAARVPGLPPEHPNGFSAVLCERPVGGETRLCESDLAVGESDKCVPLLEIDACFSDVFYAAVPGTYGSATDFLELRFTFTRSQLPAGLLPDLVRIYKRVDGSFQPLPSCGSDGPTAGQDACQGSVEGGALLDLLDPSATFTIPVYTRHNGSYRGG